jgi:hypothetical protein
MIRYFTK